MRVINLPKVEAKSRVDDIFEGGPVSVKAIADRSAGSEEFRSAIVNFSPGASARAKLLDV